MPVSFFDTLPLELQQRHKAYERGREEVEALRKQRDERRPRQLEALEDDWVGIGSKLPSEAEAARQGVLSQAEPSKPPPVVITPADARRDVRDQHRMTKELHALRKRRNLKHMEAREPHCRIVKPAVIARSTPEELAQIVRKRLERLGASIPASLRPSTRKGERELHRTLYLCRGNELVDKEDFMGAVADYNVALRARPDDVYVLLNRGNCYKAMRLWDKALADYRAAIGAVKPGRDPRVQQLLAYAHNNLGSLHHDRGDHVAAFADYTNALAFDPGCHITWKNRANIYHETAQPTADPQVPPPQHKLQFSDCLTSMDQDWHEVKGFQRGSVDINVEVRKIHQTYVAYFVVDLVRLPSGPGVEVDAPPALTGAGAPAAAPAAAALAQGSGASP